MSKRVYISADYSYDSGDRDVVEVLQRWGADDYHKVDFVDMSQVASGSVSNDPDCRPCDLKGEFNRQINASSAVIFVVGDKTAIRTAGSSCNRNGSTQAGSSCTPYKQNINGKKVCKVQSTVSAGSDNVGNINSYSYLRHEFEQAKTAGRKIIIVYNSLRNELSWLPSYMEGYENIARPFWKRNAYGNKVGDYESLKKELGFE
jgi:hypothetical protein